MPRTMAEWEAAFDAKIRRSGKDRFALMLLCPAAGASSAQQGVETQPASVQTALRALLFPAEAGATGEVNDAHREPQAWLRYLQAVWTETKGERKGMVRVWQRHAVRLCEEKEPGQGRDEEGCVKLRLFGERWESKENMLKLIASLRAEGIGRNSPALLAAERRANGGNQLQVDAEAEERKELEQECEEEAETETGHESGEEPTVQGKQAIVASATAASAAAPARRESSMRHSAGARRAGRRPQQLSVGMTSGSKKSTASKKAATSTSKHTRLGGGARRVLVVNEDESDAVIEDSDDNDDDDGADDDTQHVVHSTPAGAGSGTAAAGAAKAHVEAHRPRGEEEDNSESDDEDADPDADTVVHVDNTVCFKPAKPTSKSGGKSGGQQPVVLKRKYVDDALKNFDPDRLWQQAQERQRKRHQHQHQQYTQEQQQQPPIARRESTDNKDNTQDSQQTVSRLRGGATSSTVLQPTPHSQSRARAHGPQGHGLGHGGHQRQAQASGHVHGAGQGQGNGYGHGANDVTTVGGFASDHPFAHLLTDPARVITINNRPYLSLGEIGRGGSCTVHKVLSPSGQVLAVKKVEMRHMEDQALMLDSYGNEIRLLERLRGNPWIVELLDSEINVEASTVSLLMEQGDIDLAKSMKKAAAASTPPKQESTSAHKPQRSHHQQQQQQQQCRSAYDVLGPNFVRLAWQQMLQAVQCIHEHRIVHGDLKPANFLFVKGKLKLIDFGIAKAISNDTTNIVRDSQVGTINYMAPEAITPCGPPPSGTSSASAAQQMKLGRASDIWSLGCILYQMVYGRAPFADLNTIQKLHAIPNPEFAIQFPPHPDEPAVATIRMCLQRAPAKRPAITGAKGLLAQPFLNPRATPASHAPASSSSSAAGPSISLRTVRMIVKAAVEAAPDIERGTVEMEGLCENMLTAARSGGRTPLEDISHGGAMQMNRGVGSSSGSTTKQQPGRTNALKRIPTALRQQIASSSGHQLTSLEQSKSKRWMAARTRNEENRGDMYMAIEKKMHELRKVMGDDDTATLADTTWTENDDDGP